MDKQLVIITQAELRALAYGQDIVTDISKSTDEAYKAIEGGKGFIDGLIENLDNDIPVTREKLIRLQEYLSLAATKNVRISELAQILWRKMQDEENADRHSEEIQRGVNR